MKKVRVLKEMPFAKVGSIIEMRKGFIKKEGIVDKTLYCPEEGCNRDCGVSIDETEFNDWVKDGWIELVEEEKSLEEKFVDYEETRRIDNKLGDFRDYAQIAKEHYLEVFDKALDKGQDNVYEKWETTVNNIRKALEKA